MYTILERRKTKDISCSVQQSSAGKNMALPKCRANPKCFLPLAPLSSSPGRCSQQQLRGQTGCRIQVSECQSRQFQPAQPQAATHSARETQAWAAPSPSHPTEQLFVKLWRTAEKSSTCRGAVFWLRNCGAQAPSLVNNQEHVMEGKNFSLIQTVLSSPEPGNRVPPGMHPASLACTEEW